MASPLNDNPFIGPLGLSLNQPNSLYRSGEEKIYALARCRLVP